MGLREEKKAEQRRAILNTAAALFRKRGYEATRVRDIVERLRISEVTFFNYFPTKDAVIMAFAVEMLDVSIATVKRELERHDRSVSERIRSVIRQWATSWDEDPEFHGLVAKQSGLMTDATGILREKGLQLYRQYERLFAEGQKRGEIRADQKPLHLAEMMEGMLILIAGNWVSGWWGSRSYPLEKRFMNAMDVFLEGCAAPAPAKSRARRRGRKAGRLRAR
ncbi:MAG TPA: TetR/AcrR family transcriptional regulator [Candidatus Acidoferrales bacterium]|nr:TetR/AcrR family transcriptional regulator [Candidatus Acidoferrales bacterium]